MANLYSPNSYMGMGSNWGQMGAGTFGMPGMNQAPELFTQSVVPQDWGAAALQGQLPGGTPTIPQIGASPVPGMEIQDSTGVFDNMLGKDGWGGMALGAANGLMSSFLGMKNYGLAKQSLGENKRQFELNYGAQKQAFNNQIRGRANDLYAARGGTGQTPDEYMAQRKIA